MPNNRTIAACVALSVLVHLAMLALASLLPVTSQKAEEVMVVALSDLPRSPDFLPPKAGILEGGRPPLPPPPKPEERRKEEREVKRPQMMEGRVPDLPVNPALPPEEKFPPPRPKEETRTPPKEPSVQTALPAEKPAGPISSGGSGKPLKDLTPSLGKMVIAMEESARRGSGAAQGVTVASGGKAGNRGGIVEEGGGGASFTALNAPEIQYISYFAGIKRRIELVWGYPRDAAGIEGDVIADFVIGRSGRLESVTLIRGSGYRILDDEALGAIRKASPYDPIPTEYKNANLQIRAHFYYSVTHLRSGIH